MATNALLRSWVGRVRRHIEAEGRRLGTTPDRRAALRRGALSYLQTLFLLVLLVLVVVHLFHAGHEFTVLLTVGTMGSGWLTYRAFGGQPGRFDDGHGCPARARSMGRPGKCRRRR